jgi:uncharacterized membrane protein YsdA (DUF1294 family)
MYEADCQKKGPDGNRGKRGSKADEITTVLLISPSSTGLIVSSQQFEIKTRADPFKVYRSLSVVNPSQYIAYLQER